MLIHFDSGYLQPYPSYNKNSFKALVTIVICWRRCHFFYLSCSLLSYRACRMRSWWEFSCGLLDAAHTSRRICNKSFPWVMNMILFLRPLEFIISLNSWALAYHCKDFTEYSLPMNLAIPKLIFNPYPVKCLITIHVVWNS